MAHTDTASARRSHLSVSDATELEDGTLDTGGPAEAEVLSSIVSPGNIHRLSCRQTIN